MTKECNHIEDMFDPFGLQGYLRDESGMTGDAAGICFPRDMEEITQALLYAGGKGLKVTVQGARTGICGGAVPDGGVLVNLSKMTKITGFSYDGQMGTGSITVQAGVTLGQIQECLQKKMLDVSCFSQKDLDAWRQYQKPRRYLWFLPNPTETDASMGGLAATGAIGSHIQRGGGMESNLLAMHIVSPQGKLLYVEPNAEPVERPRQNKPDDFCGAEGTTGIIAELTLKLVPKPTYRYGLMSFHHTFGTLYDFYKKLLSGIQSDFVQIGAADWFSASCGKLLEKEKNCIAKTIEFRFPEQAAYALWLELWGESEDALYDALEIALVYMEKEDCFSELALAATDEREMERLETLRHSVMEAANLTHNGAGALLMDWRAENMQATTVDSIAECMERSCAEYIMMGHMAYGLTNFRFLEHDGTLAEMEKKITKLLRGAGCEYSSEHGCGRIKGKLLRTLSPWRVTEWEKLKARWDPDGILNCGIMAGLLQND